MRDVKQEQLPSPWRQCWRSLPHDRVEAIYEHPSGAEIWLWKVSAYPSARKWALYRLGSGNSSDGAPEPGRTFTTAEQAVAAYDKTAARATEEKAP